MLHPFLCVVGVTALKPISIFGLTHVGVSLLSSPVSKAEEAD